MEQQHAPSIFIAPDPPPFPAPPRSVDLSPLEFILALIAVITIPALIYTFFFSIKCPLTLSSWSRRRRSSDDFYPTGGSENDNRNSNRTGSKEVVSDVKYEKETHVKDIGSECPVCLSVFSDGEDIKQLTTCKHSFHASCIDIWLTSHSNCPVCRASVPVKRPPNNTSGSSNPVAPSRSRERDFQQGLPDAANLV